MAADGSDRGRLYRRFCRAAAAAFALVVVYTLLAKVPHGELARDWTHTVLHVASAVVAVCAGWIFRGAAAAKAFTAALLLVYGLLGLAGWFVDGLLMRSSLRIPLQAADNVFHLALAAGAAITVVAARRPGVRRSRAVRRSPV